MKIKILRISAPTIFLCALFGIASGAQASAVEQAVIDDALAKPLLSWENTKASLALFPGGLNGATPVVVHSAQAFYFLALEAHRNPQASEAVRKQVIAHLQNVISGGREPYIAKPLYGWSEGPLGQSLLLIRRNPLIWDALTPEEKTKTDWLMKALAISANWAFNDKNDWKTGLGDEGKFEKSYNPNYVQGTLGNMIACSLYFGARECDTVLTSFDYDTYIKQFQIYGWTNILRSWTTTGKSMMESGGQDKSGGNGVGVKVAFSYQGIGLTDTNGIFYRMAVASPKNALYNRVTTNGTKDGKAHIITAGASSPTLGKFGMINEFESSDTKGDRSDALYAYEGWMGNVAVRASMQALGVWGGPNQKEVEEKMLVGSTDLIYKLANGYHGVYMGRSRDIYDKGDAVQKKGYLYIKEIWEKMLAPSK